MAGATIASTVCLACRTPFSAPAGDRHHYDHQASSGPVLRSRTQHCIRRVRVVSHASRQVNAVQAPSRQQDAVYRNAGEIGLQFASGSSAFVHSQALAAPVSARLQEHSLLGLGSGVVTSDGWHSDKAREDASSSSSEAPFVAPAPAQLDANEAAQLQGTDQVAPKERLRRQRIASANRGKMPWNIGKKHSEETKARIRERTKIAMQRPEIREKLRINGRKQSLETRQKISAAMVAARKLRKAAVTAAAEAAGEDAKPQGKAAVERPSSSAAPDADQTQRPFEPECQFLHTFYNCVQRRRASGKWDRYYYPKADNVHTEPWKTCRSELEALRQLQRKGLLTDQVRESLLEEVKEKLAVSQGHDVVSSRLFKSTTHRERIAEAIRAKWRDPDYRSKVESAQRGDDSPKPRKGKPSTRSAQISEQQQQQEQKLLARRRLLEDRARLLWAEAEAAHARLEQLAAAGMDTTAAALAAEEIRRILDSAKLPRVTQPSSESGTSRSSELQNNALRRAPVASR
eukprot:jgi/Chlat1/2230/Chrsp17S02556